MAGGSGRTIELTGGRGGEGLTDLFRRVFFRGCPCVKRLGRAPPRLAKRYCRLHGSTVSAKSQNLKNQQKYIQNGTKGEPWMRAKLTFKVPWLTGFITFWPCAPKPRKNVPNCVRSVQSKCRGRQKTEKKQHSDTNMHKNAPESHKMMVNC